MLRQAGLTTFNENGAQLVAGRTVTASVEITRPSDTTAYAAKDVVSGSTTTPSVLTFADVAGESAGAGYIVKARLMTDQSGNTARFRLHLFHTAPTAINDNSQYALLYANAANRIGHIDFDACQTEGTGSTAANTSNTTVRMAFLCAAASKALYGILEVLDAFNPATGQKFFVELTSEQN